MFPRVSAPQLDLKSIQDPQTTGILMDTEHFLNIWEHKLLGGYNLKYLLDKPSSAMIGIGPFQQRRLTPQRKAAQSHWTFGFKLGLSMNLMIY